MWPWCPCWCMYCDTAQAKAGNVTYLWSCLSSLGPRANSISDLWWMVWQEGVTQIVMLTNIQEGGKVGSWAYWLCPCFCTVQFSSIQFKMVSIRWGKKRIYIPPRLSEVSPTCLRKGSNVHRVDDDPLLYVLSRKIVERFLFLGLFLLQEIDCVMSLGSVTGGTVSSSSSPNTIMWHHSCKNCTGFRWNSDHSTR